MLILYKIYYIDIYFYPNTIKNSIEIFLLDKNKKIDNTQQLYNKKIYHLNETLIQKLKHIIKYNSK
jgi:hypothetical protein